jgi:hypothetical protein
MKNKHLQLLLQQFPDDIEVLITTNEGTELIHEVCVDTTRVAKVLHKKGSGVSYHFDKDEHWYVCGQKQTLQDLGSVKEEVVVILE